jgi:hypothetical protein
VPRPSATRRRRGPGSSAEFSRDGRFLVSGSLYAVAVWDGASGTLRRRLPAFGAATWLPGTSVVVAGRFGDQPGIGFRDAATGRIRETVPTSIRAGISIAVSRDGRYLAVGFGRETGGEIVRRADGRRLASTPVMRSSGCAPCSPRRPAYRTIPSRRCATDRPRPIG